MIKGYIFDMDGVIWDGNRRIPHAVDGINRVIRAGREYMFMTNNALRSRKSYVERLERHGIRTGPEHVVTASYAAGLYIRRKSGPSCTYPMGTRELGDELESAGHKIVDEGADFVVVGLDKELTYSKMDKAFRNLLAGAELIACAPDLTYLEDGHKHIGSGAFARVLEMVSGRELIIVGKPNTIMVELAIEKMRLKPEEVLMVGDKLHTDILAAKKAGMRAALVLTGETDLTDVGKSNIKPDYIIKDLRELPEEGC